MTSTRLAYTRNEAADICGLPLDAIARAINSGELRAKRHGRRYLITEQALRDWLDQLDDA